MPDQHPLISLPPARILLGVIPRATQVVTAALLSFAWSLTQTQAEPPAVRQTNELADVFPIPKSLSYPYVKSGKPSPALDYSNEEHFLAGPIPASMLKGQYSGTYALSNLIVGIERCKEPGKQARMLENLSGSVDNFLSIEKFDLGNAYGFTRSKLGENLLVISPRLKKIGKYDALVGKMMEILLGGIVVADHPTINMDMANQRLPLLWALVAQIDNPALQDRYAKQLQRVMNHALGSQWPGHYSKADLLTPDGGTIHHNTNHLAYASYSLPSVTSLASKLQHTKYKLSDLAIHRLNTVLFCQSFLTFGDLWVPGNSQARISVDMVQLDTLPYMLAHMATVGGSDANPLMASLYLAKVPNPESDPLAREFRAKGITPARLEGNWSLNVSASVLHRRDDWLVSLHGANNERRGAEIYSFPGTGNNYCRYGLNGSVMVFSTPDPKNGKITPESCGYSVNGWDWSHFPGATSPIRPPFELMSKRPGYPTNYHPFAGGTWLGLDGIFGMNFRGADINFRKSAFFFDNRITILTSDIHPKVESPSSTTLFQLALPDTTQPLTIDGEEKAAFPFASTLPAGEDHWLIDTKSTGYYVHPGSSPLVVTRSTQSWPFLDKMTPDTPAEVLALLKRRNLSPDQAKEAISWCDPSTGPFDLAYLDHGNGDTPDRPAYTMFIRTNEKEMRAVAEKMKDPATAPYRILQQDTTAHVLVDQASKTTSYVVFEPNTALSATGPLIQSSRPALAMFRKTGDGMALSLGVPDGQRTKEATALTLQGKWKPEATALAPDVSHGDNQTVLTFHTKDYLPIQIMLHPVKP